MVTTVISLVEDRDLDLRNQLKNDPEEAGDQTAQGSKGEWYPLHEYFMSFVTIPFYVLLGVPGCLVFNVLLVIVLQMILYDLCCHYVDHHSAFAAVVLTGLTTLLLDYTYSYSIDVFAAFWLVASYWGMVHRKFMVSGIIWGLSVFARVTNLVTAPAFAAFLFLEVFEFKKEGTIPENSRLQKLLKCTGLFLLGVIPGALMIALMNWNMFGSPFMISYYRWQHFVGGAAVLSSQENSFSVSFINGLPAVLFDRGQGLFFRAPTLLLALPFGLRQFWHCARNDTVLYVSILVTMVGLFSKYELWAFGGGYRYLVSVAVLGALPLSFAIAKLRGPSAADTCQYHCKEVNDGDKTGCK